MQGETTSLPRLDSNLGVHDPQIGAGQQGWTTQSKASLRSGDFPVGIGNLGGNRRSTNRGSKSLASDRTAQRPLGVGCAETSGDLWMWRSSRGHQGWLQPLSADIFVATV